MRFFAFIVLVMLAGCVSEQQGSASIYVKDAPTDEFDEIHVVFSQVEVHRGSGDGNWTTIVDETHDIDLLNATGATAAFLGESDLEAGNYTQIRIHVDEAYGIKDGNRTDITVSSGVLKIVRGFDVEEGKETRIVLDIDLDQSIREQGNGQWRMTPVIGKSWATIVEDDESGEEVDEEGQNAELEELEGEEDGGDHEGDGTEGGA